MSPDQFNALVAELRQAVQHVNSPYRDRAGAAAYLQCSERTVDEFLATGELPKHWIGSKPLVKVSDLDALVDRQTAIGRKRNFSRRAA